MKISERHTISKKVKRTYTDDSRVDDAWKTLKEEMDKLKEKEFPYGKYIEPRTDAWPEKSEHCLHKNCPGCKSGTCSGIHMISCPCKNCTPWTMTTERIGYNTISDTGNRIAYYAPSKKGFWIGSNYVGPSETVLTYSGLHTQ